jgi:hypothetical protein
VGFSAEGYGFFDSKIIGICIAIVIGPNLQKFIDIVIGDEIHRSSKEKSQLVRF